ncbi:hypothetical protein GLOIN_2v1711726 [Rhizophagus irregularis DAOM 181602=DAOM 197198]|uniref:Uncharacterized protein n=1 Tax=Rhizophagus irregularis (strain DAOM 181602 / DAOM 197198 / MUCL 43194) TaxID=747089 RepID=A0A2P4P5E0_RHIID|nr:hypothetical protein GLOIN_2v1711726 [Rhizophagus irregularis DAOM 181602=DAOM 197198]POG60605.1 hypothetical protein GLOIN_2v1711726 [Rhizophagus irregularis DAOM 181602=DAOM 197198]|eukprot:XP_025167471.1 hypothetical protein GLOIN_2v1711726 [Rhizophagus irregularis DAOM 181602=DAOM 197198]
MFNFNFIYLSAFKMENTSIFIFFYFANLIALNVVMTKIIHCPGQCVNLKRIEQNYH